MLLQLFLGSGWYLIPGLKGSKSARFLVVQLYQLDTPGIISFFLFSFNGTKHWVLCWVGQIPGILDLSLVWQKLVTLTDLNSFPTNSMPWDFGGPGIWIIKGGT